MVRFTFIFTISLLLGLSSLKLYSAPGQNPPSAGTAGGKGQPEPTNLFNFDQYTASVSYGFGIGMPSYFPELEYVLSTHILRVGTTFRPGHTVEGNFITSKDNGVKITSFGVAYRPYTSLDVIAAYGIFGFNYFKMSTYYQVGKKSRPNASPNLGMLAGGGVLIPLSDTFYARPAAEFYFQPGITLILSIGLEVLF